MSTLSQTIFESLPLVIREAAVAFVGRRNKKTRYGKTYQEYIRLLEHSQYWDAEQQARFQAEQLGLLISEARAFTRAYKHLPSFTFGDLLTKVSSGNLDGLPTLSKTQLRKEGALFLNTSRKTAMRSSTSGSTGSPMVIEHDGESIQRRFAFMHAHRSWLGLSAFPRSIRLSGRRVIPATTRHPPFWIFNRPENQLLLSVYHLSTSNSESINEKIRSMSVELLDGYPSAIAQLGDLLGSMARELPLKGIITTAETLDDELRATIERHFAVPVLDYYSASEGLPLVQQCPAGSYHHRFESGIIEILDPDGTPTKTGEVGEIVVTSFCQLRTPLIRYRTGDMAVKEAATDCQCGRTLPVVGKILGRWEDFVLTQDGRRIGMFSYLTLKSISGIREAQIRQTGLASFSVQIVSVDDSDAPEVDRRISRSFEQVLGYPVSVSVERVSAIPRGPNGKFRAVLRDIQ